MSSFANYNLLAGNTNAERSAIRFTGDYLNLSMSNALDLRGRFDAFTIFAAFRGSSTVLCKNDATYKQYMISVGPPSNALAVQVGSLSSTLSTLPYVNVAMVLTGLNKIAIQLYVAE